MNDQEQVIEDASLPHASPPASSSAANDDDDDAVVGTFIFPLRKLAVVNPLLLAICYCLLLNTCLVARMVHFEDTEWEMITTWQVLYAEDIRSDFDSNKEAIGHLNVGDVCEVYGNVEGVPNDEDIRSEFGRSRMHVVSPVNGWLMAESSDSFEDNNNRMKKLGLSERQIGSVCPLFGAGPTDEDKQRFHMAPWSLVVAQMLWNAAQVVHLLILLVGIVSEVITTTGDRGGCSSSIRVVAVGFVTTLSVAMLPFSVYFGSPGGIIYSVLVLLCSLFTLQTTASSSSEDKFRIVVADKKEFAQHYHPSSGQRGSCRYLGKVELVAFLCNLGSSMYNFTTLNPPYWRNMFHGLDSIMSWTTYSPNQTTSWIHSLDCFVPELYTLGISGVRVPLFVPRSRGSTTGHFVFLIWWSWLPFLYTIYFGLMYLISDTVPGSKIQKRLCAWAIFHFLILTDLVDYKYGRGIKTVPFLSQLCHWSERFVWRIAILLPLYQNVCSAKWKRAGRFGIVVHYVLAIWGVVFFVYQVIMNDMYKLLQFFEGIESRDMVMMFGWKYLWVMGYLGLLSFMWIFYAITVIGYLPVRYVSIQKFVDVSSTQSSLELSDSISFLT